jgi:hypothetical protein
MSRCHATAIEAIPKTDIERNSTISNTGDNSTRASTSMTMLNPRTPIISSHAQEIFIAARQWVRTSMYATRTVLMTGSMGGEGIGFEVAMVSSVLIHHRHACLATQPNAEVS